MNCQGAPVALLGRLPWPLQRSSRGLAGRRCGRCGDPHGGSKLAVVDLLLPSHANAEWRTITGVLSAMRLRHGLEFLIRSSGPGTPLRVSAADRPEAFVSR